MQTVDDHFGFDEVVFFGRDLAEYVQMFNLDLAKLRNSRILDCPGGPATFALEAEAHGIEVVACDPLYHRDADSLMNLINNQLATVKSRVEKAAHLFDKDKPQLDVSQRIAMYKRFLADYARPAHRNTRYVNASLPSLPFADSSFDYATSGNLLFLYSDFNEGGMLFNSPFDYDFHRSAILELMRLVKHDLRMYPTKGPHSAEQHKFIPRIMSDMTAAGFTCAIEQVPYRDIKGAHHMLRISKTLPR